MKYRKKPVVVEAITFAELVEHGKVNGANIVNGMPWSWNYAGHPITHENDECYLIPTLEGTMKMTPGDMLITGVKGEIYPCKSDIFAATYDSAEKPAPDGDGACHGEAGFCDKHGRFTCPGGTKTDGEGGEGGKVMRLDIKEDAAKLRLKTLEAGVVLLQELIANGPYQNDDGKCSFCLFAPNDSEDLGNLVGHEKDCLWRRSKEYLAALDGGAGMGDGR